ncbi:NERD domain-containing protein [Texcoconibacillus texcoconensis]|uniref:NERD domain-containing protein n=1 Tax=Texcoconibacillus texcoconensis TaxID=1095777 RepID=A0A840QSF7_9BACI|nr:hypothetical protein [Texcoconibacillus texcoconensis]
MIYKPRSFPVVIHQLESLQNRVPAEHRHFADIEKDFKLYKKGYRGEHSLDYYFNFLSVTPHFLLHNLRIPNDKGGFFQLDTVLITPYFYVIVEVKNLSGTVTFDPTFEQVIRTYNGQEVAHPHPIHQVNMQVFHFKNWLHKHQLPSMPVYPLVVFSDPSTTIKAVSHHEQFADVVIHAHSLLSRIDDFSMINANRVGIDECQLRKVGVPPL